MKLQEKIRPNLQQIKSLLLLVSYRLVIGKYLNLHIV